MSFTERAINSIESAVAKGIESAESALWNTAKVQTVANVLGIGTTSASLALMAVEYAPEIAKTSKAIAEKLVRKFP